MIAYCGINCSECNAYIATQTDNDILRKEVAKEWSETYNTEIKAEDIQCDGCKSENGILFSIVLNVKSGIVLNTKVLKFVQSVVNILVRNWILFIIQLPMQKRIWILL